MIIKSKVGLRLLGVNLLSLLVATVGLVVVIQYLATQQILRWHQQRVDLVARLVLAEYQGKIQRVAQAAKLLADNPTYGELLAAGDIPTLRRLATPMMKATGLHILTITDRLGVIQVRAHDPGAIGVNIFGNPVIRAGLQGKEASRMTQWQESLSLSASAPIMYQGQVLGVVLTGILVDRSFVESLSLSGAEVAIFFANRLVVNSFQDLSETALASLRQFKDQAAPALDDAKLPQNIALGDQAYTVTLLPLEGEGKPWENLIAVGINRAELVPTLNTLKMVIFGVGGASALIGALLSIWLSWGMRRQITFLAEGTRRAAREDLIDDIPVTRGDELGELAQSFNNMTRALREKTRLLHEERDHIAANADFLSMIVHDIKAPLAGLRLTIEALEDEELPPGLHYKLQGIIQRSEGLLMHLHNVLYLSRYESGLLALRPEALPPRYAVQRVLHHFAPLAQQQQVTLHSTLGPELPPLQADEPSLERVLANLLVNALAATPPGGKISLEGRRRDGDHPEVEIVVADTGVGISPEDQEHLFEKYQQHRHKSNSSGLGLYICKTLVEANHGRIWVESQPGRGSQFHIALPVAQEEAPAPTAGAPEASPEA
jgi:signal transduction histidine kinase